MLALGYTYPQGNYFTQPEIPAGKRLSNSGIAVIRLLGMFALMNAHFGMTLAEFLKHLPLDQDESGALLDRSGKLGSLLARTELAGMPNFIYSNNSLGEIGRIEPSALLSLQLESVEWANSIGQEQNLGAQHGGARSSS
ncbi:MAG: hypothetical protein ACKVQA_22920 [Burkholderiales bacterium]